MVALKRADGYAKSYPCYSLTLTICFFWAPFTHNEKMGNSFFFFLMKQNFLTWKLKMGGVCLSHKKFWLYLNWDRWLWVCSGWGSKIGCAYTYMDDQIWDVINATCGHHTIIGAFFSHSLLCLCLLYLLVGLCNSILLCSAYGEKEA